MEAWGGPTYEDMYIHIILYSMGEWKLKIVYNARFMVDLSDFCHSLHHSNTLLQIKMSIVTGFLPIINCICAGFLLHWPGGLQGKLPPRVHIKFF